MGRKNSSGNLVYSTGPVTPEPDPDPIESEKAPSSSIEAVISIEKKGRGGKSVTVVEIRGVNPDHAKSIGKKLKAACGVGGTTKGTTVEVQGDQRPKVREVLEKEGLRVKGG